MQGRGASAAAGGAGGSSQRKQIVAAKKSRVRMRAVNKWVALGRAGGLKVLKPKRQGLPTGVGRLDVKQAGCIRGVVIDEMPDQSKLSFYLSNAGGHSRADHAGVRHRGFVDKPWALFEGLGCESTATSTPYL